MGEAKRRDRSVQAYLTSVEGISCPSCGATGFDVVDLYTEVPLFHEPGMPRENASGPLPRYLCGHLAGCFAEWD